MLLAYVCEDSFDEFGNCIEGLLPWNTMSEFEHEFDRSEMILQREFLDRTGLEAEDIKGEELFYAMGNVLVSYNPHTDSYTLYVK